MDENLPSKMEKCFVQILESKFFSKNDLREILHFSFNGVDHYSQKSFLHSASCMHTILTREYESLKIKNVQEHQKTENPQSTPTPKGGGGKKSSIFKKKKKKSTSPTPRPDKKTENSNPQTSPKIKKILSEGNIEHESNKDIKPLFAFIYFIRGLCFKKLKKYIASIRDLSCAILLDKKTYNTPDIRNNLAVMNFYVKRYKDTVLHSLFAILLDQNFQYGWSSGAAGYMELGDYDNALKFIDKSIDISSDCWDVSLRGMINVKKQKYLMAYVDFYNAYRCRNDYSLVCDYSKGNYQQLSSIKVCLFLDLLNVTKDTKFILKGICYKEFKENGKIYVNKIRNKRDLNVLMGFYKSVENGKSETFINGVVPILLFGEIMKRTNEFADVKFYFFDE